MNNKDLVLVHESNNNEGGRARRIYLICVFRDEYLLLDYFVNYYKSLGVTNFIFVDNLSEDRGPDFIRNIEGVNIKLFFAEGSYKEANFGTSWVNYLLNEYCQNEYCFTVDVDELFCFRKQETFDLQVLINQMELVHANVVPVTLLDMYPKVINNGYSKGEDFLKHSQYFDKYNSDYYSRGSLLYKKFYHKKGGMRKRLLNTTVCIHKFPFFKYDFHPLCISAGYHFFQNDEGILTDSEKIHLFNIPAILLHFKFIKPNIESFFKKRVLLNQDWDDSVEYRSYVEVISKKREMVFYDKKISKSINSKKDLDFFFGYY